VTYIRDIPITAPKRAGNHPRRDEALDAVSGKIPLFRAMIEPRDAQTPLNGIRCLQSTCS